MLEYCVAATSPEILTEPTRVKPAIDSGHIDALTGYRGLAALVVLVVHGAGHTAYPNIGLHGYGPIALFTLSGYLLISPWAKWARGRAAHPDLRTFARRRVMRIFPAYLVTLFVVALIYPASRPQGEMSWLRAITLTNFLGGDGLRPAMQHVWSMGTEFSWYLALPFIGGLLGFLGRKIFVRRPRFAMYIVVILALAANLGWVVWVDRNVHDMTGLLTYPMWLPAFVAVFLLGAMVKFLESSPQGPLREGGWLRSVASRTWVVVLAAGVAVAVLHSDLSGPSGYVPMTFSERQTRNVAAVTLALVLLIGIGAARPGSILKRVFSGRFIVAVGRWSYGIYLWHLPVTVLLAENMTVPEGPVGFVAWILLLLAISASLGAMTYAWVERPAIAWSKRASL